MLVVIKGNVVKYVITSISMNMCSYSCIKRLLLNVIIRITFIAHVLLYVLPDPHMMAIAFVSFFIIHFLYCILHSCVLYN